jgi:hypothetical protein
MSCRCDTTRPLELTREAISQRAKQTRELKRVLAVLTDHPDREHQLRRCETCGQLWQRANAWNWGAKEYFFIVPPVETQAWLDLPFVDPDELLIWVSTIDGFVRKGDFRPGPRQCAEAACHHSAIQYSVLCIAHHIASLQAVHILPPTPRGRFYAPYDHLKPEKLNEYLAAQQQRIEPVV